jgi:hypothetical protein
MPEETHQHELQLEEVGIEPDKEMTGVNLSEEVVEQQFSGEIAELEYATEWLVTVTKYESNMGVQYDTPTRRHEDLHLRRLHQKHQSMKQLEEVIEDIRELMLRSREEFVSKEKLEIKEPARVSRGDAAA